MLQVYLGLETEGKSRLAANGRVLGTVRKRPPRLRPMVLPKTYIRLVEE